MGMLCIGLLSSRETMAKASPTVNQKSQLFVHSQTEWECHDQLLCTANGVCTKQTWKARSHLKGGPSCMGDRAWLVEPGSADSEEARLALFLVSALPVQRPKCQLIPANQHALHKYTTCKGASSMQTNETLSSLECMSIAVIQDAC